MGQVDVLGALPAKCLVEQVVLWCRCQVFLSADHMRDRHQVIVDDVGKIVRWKTIRFQKHLVVQLIVVNGDLTIDMIIITAHTRIGDALPDDRDNAFVEFRLDLCGGQVSAGVAIALHAFASHFQGGFILFLIKTIISISALDQFESVFFVNGQTLALDVWSVAAVFVRTFVVLDPSQV